MVPKVVVLAIIEKDGNVLLAKRAKEPEGGKWALPGGVGFFKKFSDPEKVVMQEVAYDLNVEFKIKRFFTYSFGVFEGEPTITLVFLGNINQEINKNPKATSECKFFSQEEFVKLDKKELAFDCFEILKKFFS